MSRGLFNLGKYKHYKGDFYEVLGICRHSETMEEFVLYRSLIVHPDFGNAPYWVRPMKMFLEDVEVDGKKVKRFEFIGD